jgi:hypothetical protein
METFKEQLFIFILGIVLGIICTTIAPNTAIACCNIIIFIYLIWMSYKIISNFFK